MMKMTIEELEFPNEMKTKILKFINTSRINVEFVCGRKIAFTKTNLGIEELKERQLQLENLNNDLKIIKDTSGDMFNITLMKDTFTERSAAGEKLKHILAILGSEERVIGEIGGFKILGLKEPVMNQTIIHIKGNGKYRVELDNNPLGNITRLENAVKSLPNKVNDIEYIISGINEKIEETNLEIKKPFTKNEELNILLERKSEIDLTLGIEKKDEEIMETEYIIDTNGKDL